MLLILNTFNIYELVVKIGWVIFIKIKELEWSQPEFNPVELPRETILFLSAQSHHNVLFHSPHGG